MVWCWVGWVLVFGKEDKRWEMLGLYVFDDVEWKIPSRREEEDSIGKRPSRKAMKSWFDE